MPHQGRHLKIIFCVLAGELKRAVSLATGLEPREQRLLFKGKEREDSDHLHMVGVRDRDKVVLLEDPAIKERKLQLAMRSRIQALGSSNCPAIVEVQGMLAEYDSC